MASAAPPTSGPVVRAWRPGLPEVREVLHARFTDHAYPLHTHDTWTLLLVDTGAVGYDLDHHEHAASRRRVTLLPPHVPHNGRALTREGFRKRVVYLEPDVLDAGRIGRAADHPGWADGVLHRHLGLLHGALDEPGETLAAQSWLALVTERLRAHLDRLPEPGADERADPEPARRLRDLLDARVVEGITLTEAAAQLDVSPARLVRSFGRHVGLPPHRYLTGRRLDRSRRLLLAGRPPAEVAVEVGFHDQAHLTRHFRRFLGTTPSAYALSA